MEAVHDNAISHNLKHLAISLGNPPLVDFEIEHLDKLIEDPTSLNIKKTMSIVYMLKTEIIRVMQDTAESIINQHVRNIMIYSKMEEPGLRAFLLSIKPLFPRFFSKVRPTTYFRIVDSITGLFQNSRTIRNYFKGRMSQSINNILIMAERSSRKILLSKSTNKNFIDDIWFCSSTQADQLRLISWGEPVLGATIPHPLDLIIEQKHCVLIAQTMTKVKII